MTCLKHYKNFLLKNHRVDAVKPASREGLASSFSNQIKTACCHHHFTHFNRLKTTLMDFPLIISKAWLMSYYNRTFRWIRKHILTDEVLTKELDFDLDAFRNWRDFPPKEGNKLKKWLVNKKLV